MDMGASPHTSFGAYKPSTAGGADLTSMQKSSKSRPALKKKHVWEALRLDPIQGNEIRDTTNALRHWLAHSVFRHVLRLLSRVNERREQVSSPAHLPLYTAKNVA